jgi:O-antigen/teichoic acid export membrane protein
VVDEGGKEPEYITRARRDVVRGSLWTSVATTLGMPISLAANVLVARSLGTHGLGRFATYTAIFAIVLAVTNLGFSEATVQWLASATARGEETERRELIRRCAGFHLFLSAPASACCAFLLLAGSGPVVAIGGALAVCLMQGLGTSTVINTATARNALTAQLALIAGTAGQIGLVTAAIASHRPGITWAVQLSLMFVGPLLAISGLTPDERSALFRPRLALRGPSGFWTYAASACIGGLVATLVFGRSEVLVLRANGLLAGAGVFTVITGLAGQMTGPLDSLLAPLTPIAAGLVAIDRPRAVRAFERSLRVTAILGTLASCVLVPAGVVGIRVLYGHAFASAPAPFAVLGLVSCLQTVVGAFTAFAFATRSAARVLRINVVCLVVDATIAISLVPILGLWGAVVANCAAQILSLLWMSSLVSRRLGLPVARVVEGLRLFGAGLALGALEAAICVGLRGLAELGVVPIVAVSLVAMRFLLTRFPTLRLTAEDVALILASSSSRKLELFLRVLAYARITA